MPVDKFDELDEFVSKLEEQSKTANKTLSYAGAWAKIDDDIFGDLTDKLIQNRKKSRRRFNE